MENVKTLIYDGSFNGFLTAVFIAFDEKIQVADIQKNSVSQNGLFSETETIFTRTERAKRVWNGIQKKSHTAIKNIYFAYLSETEGVELLLYRYIQQLFVDKKSIYSDSSDDSIFKISQLATSVGREKHRMEAFVRFQLSRDDIYFATIEPDFDVLPLISKHFRSKYADRQWLIYDVKRKYGIYYDLEYVEIVSLDLTEIYNNNINKNHNFSAGEYEPQDFSNHYFKSTNIKSRINRKLHPQNVPKRQWKYLGEKKEAV